MFSVMVLLLIFHNTEIQGGGFINLEGLFSNPHADHWEHGAAGLAWSFLCTLLVSDSPNLGLWWSGLLSVDCRGGLETGVDCIPRTFPGYFPLYFCSC